MNSATSDESLSIIDLGRIISAKWRLVALTTLVVLLIAVAAAFLTEPVYRSTVVLMPVDQAAGTEGLGQMLGGLGGLANFAGIPLANSDGTDESLAILSSKVFFREFIQSRGLLPVLFSEQWDADADDNPSINDAVRKFADDVVSIQDDPLNSVISLSVEWTDRELAARWANDMVALVNARIRDRRIAEAKKSLSFLERELKSAQAVELKSAINQLMLEQIKAIMLANVLEDYAFQVIDPAFISDDDDYIRPNELILILIGLFGGCALGIFAALIKYSAVG